MMTKWDEDYIKAAEKVLNEGTKTENRTGTDTSKKQEDIKIKQYKHMGPIKFPIAK